MWFHRNQLSTLGKKLILTIENQSQGIKPNDFIIDENQIFYTRGEDSKNSLPKWSNVKVKTDQKLLEMTIHQSRLKAPIDCFVGRNSNTRTLPKTKTADTFNSGFISWWVRIAFLGVSITITVNWNVCLALTRFYSIFVDV